MKVKSGERKGSAREKGGEREGKIREQGGDGRGKEAKREGKGSERGGERRGKEGEKDDEWERTGRGNAGEREGGPTSGQSGLPQPRQPDVAVPVGVPLLPLLELHVGDEQDGGQRLQKGRRLLPNKQTLWSVKSSRLGYLV